MAGDNIEVAVRLRPLIERERNEKAQIRWVIEENSVRSVDPTDSRCNDPYTFDHIFGMDVNNERLYEKIVAPLVLSCAEGYHCTIFTYGQTSSGKTHTMDGTRLDPGVIPRVVDQLFQIINQRNNCKFLIRVAYIEIYNERIYDLLNKQNTETKIREDLQGNITVCAEELVTSTKDQVLELMQFGKKNRKIHSTRMNIKSSRSHTIFRIIVECTEEDEEGVNRPVKVSHFNLVDLAGSERVAQTKATGQRLVEGAAINKSLSTLTLVISQLADKSKFLNYRDSKLTLILKNALGGNAKTLIIANITAASLEDTHSTLSFAKRAKTIKNKPVINTTATSLLSQCQEQIQKLQRELRLVSEQNKDLASHLLERIKLNRQAFAKPESVCAVSKRRHTIGQIKNINTAEEFRNMLTEDWTVPSAGIPLTAVEKRLLQVVRTNSHECSKTETANVLPFEAQFLNLSLETNDVIPEDEAEDIEAELSIANYTLDDVDSETDSDQELRQFEELERCIAAAQTTEDLQNDLKKLRVITKSFTSRYAQQVALNKMLETRNRLLSDEITDMMKKLTCDEENRPTDENLRLEVANLHQKLIDQDEVLTQLKMKHQQREEELSISLAEHRKEKQSGIAKFDAPEGGDTSKAAKRDVPDIGKLDAESLSVLEENILKILTGEDEVQQSEKERRVLLRLLNSTEGTLDAYNERYRSLERLSTKDLSDETSFKAALEEFSKLLSDEIENSRSEVEKINSNSAGLNKLLRKINDYNSQDVSIRVSTLEKQLKQADLEISENKIERNKLNNTITNLNSKVSGLNQSVLELETQLKLQKSLTSAVQQNYDLAKHEISEDKVELEKLQNDRTKLNNIILDLNGNVSTLNQQVSELKRQLDQQINRACVLQKNYDQVKFDILESKAKFDNLQEEKNELDQRVLQLEQQVESEKNTARSIWVDYQQVNFENSENIIKLGKLQKQVEESNELNQKIPQYKQRISELTANLIATTSKLETTEDCLLEVLEDLSMKEKELERLQKTFRTSKVLKDFNETYYENKLKHIESVLSSFNDLTTKTIRNKLYRTKSLCSIDADAETKPSISASFSSLHNISLCEHVPTLRDIINDLVNLNRLLQKTTSTQNLQANEGELVNLKQIIQGKVTELTEMEETLNETKNRNVALEELFQDYNKEIQDYKKQIHDYKKEIQDYKKDIENFRIETTNLKRIYQGLSATYANTKRACEACMQENSMMRKSVQELTQLKCEVETELRDRNSSLVDKCRSLQDNIEQVKVQATEEIYECNTKYMSTVEQNKLLMDKLNRLETEKAERLQMTKKRDSEIADIQKELQDLELKLNNSNKELRKIRSRCVCEGASNSSSPMESWKNKRRGLQDCQRDLSCSSCNELKEKIKNLEMKIFNMEAQLLRPPERSTSEIYYQCRAEVLEKEIRDLKEEHVKLLSAREKLVLERDVPSTSGVTPAESQKRLVEKLQEQVTELSAKYNQAKAIVRRRGHQIAELESQLKKKE